MKTAVHPPLVESSTQSPTPGARNFYLQLWPWFAAAMSGFLLALCFPRWNQTWLCWIALAPWISSVWFSCPPARRKWARDALLGYVAGLVFFSMTFSWLSTLGRLFASPWLLGLPLLLATYMAVYFAFWSWIVGRLASFGFQVPNPGARVASSRGAAFDLAPSDGLQRGTQNAEPATLRFLSSRWNLWIAFLGASAWVAHEWVRGWMFTGFGWNGLGVALHKNLAMIQITDVTGVAGLSFLVAFANLLGVITVRRFIAEIRGARLRPHWDFNLTMLLIVIVFGYGARVLMRREPPALALRVAAVQAGIPQDEKFDEAFEDSIFDRYLALTDEALRQNPQLLVWPEAATPRGIFADEKNHQFVRSIAQRGDFNFLLGSIDSDLNEHNFNIAALFSEHGRHVQVYQKIHLVPFGEFIPFRNSFPLFAKVAGDLVPGDFTPGREFTVFQTENPPVKLAPLICFEDTLGDLTRRFVLGGADVLVNMTNDGWFLDSAGAEQHMANAVFRAIETRRPFVRAANTGVTCLVDRAGRITTSLPPPRDGRFTADVLSGTLNVALDAGTTFYTRHGDILAIACAAVTCGWVLLNAKFRR